VSADTHALDRIFNNLFSNALDAMPDGGKLNVATKILSCDVEGEPDRMVEVRVEDTGPGIPPEIQEQLFDEFVTTKRRGLGLGLSIAKKLTDAHGGNITIISSAGIGTTCSVRLPLKVN
jgi:signal transduction histidine kinase